MNVVVECERIEKAPRHLHCDAPMQREATQRYMCSSLYVRSLASQSRVEVESARERSRRSNNRRKDDLMKRYALCKQGVRVLPVWLGVPCVRTTALPDLLAACGASSFGRVAHDRV